MSNYVFEGSAFECASIACQAMMSRRQDVEAQGP